jgi:hypothetical protein
MKARSAVFGSLVLTLVPLGCAGWLWWSAYTATNNLVTACLLAVAQFIALAVLVRLAFYVIVWLSLPLLFVYRVWERWRDRRRRLFLLYMLQASLPAVPDQNTPHR